MNLKLSAVLLLLVLSTLPQKCASSPHKSQAKPKKISKSFRTNQQSLLKAMKADLVSKTVTRFEGKHLFHNGKLHDINGNPVNSFEALSADPDGAKQYMLDLNKKLCKGAVLPQVGDDIIVNGVTEKGQFNKWLDKMDTHAVSIIDADASVLKADLQNQFNNHKSSMAAQGKVDAAGNIVLTKGEKMPNFMTDESYPVTHITFQASEVDPVTGQVTKVSVKAEQIQTRIELGTDSFGNPSHFEKIDPTRPQLVLHESTEIASFSKQELKVNAEVTQEFWKKLGVSTQGTLLNENHALYEVFKQTADAEFHKRVEASTEPTASTSNVPGTCPGGRRRKRAAGSRCAFMLNSNGDLDAVNPKVFLDEYKMADSRGKHDMAEMVKDHTDKIVAADMDLDSDAQNVVKLVQLEEMKAHVTSVDNVKNLQGLSMDSDLDTGSSKLSGMLSGFEDGFSQVKSKVKLSMSKVSRSLAKFASNKFVKGFSKNVGMVSNTIGKFFLAKTFIRGIIHGDATSLALASTSAAIELTVWAGGKFFSEASKIGKFTSKLGKVAGPVGAIVDIGLNIWSLTKSVDRLKKAKNRYERDDAIADIVGSSIDIVVTATVAVVSSVFPPAAAIGAVIDLLAKLAVALFKAQNEVNRINAEIPLLGHEKSYAFTSRFFDWFGTRKPDYLESMLKEKAANDIAVKHNANFLQQNDDFLGIVFPSRTLHYDGACRLTKRHCPLKNIWGCTRWEDRETVGRGCDWRRPCGYWGICDDHWVSTGTWGYDDFECKCDGTAKTTFGYPRTDSFVDFRSKSWVYWERTVPKDVENSEFKCKPGTPNFIDYKVSQQSSRYEFYCKHAIGLLQPNHRRKSGQMMIFALEDGRDTIFAGEDSTPNVFRMGNQGHKQYYGGQGQNEFVFDSECNSSLAGNIFGGQGVADRVSFGENCTKDHRIHVDFSVERISNSLGTLSISTFQIEEVIGRKGQGETVLASCATKKVQLGGGSASMIDEITIPKNSSCNYKLVVIVNANTNLTSDAENGTLDIPIGDQWTGVHLDVTLKKELKVNIMFAQTAISEVFNVTLGNQTRNTLAVRLGSSSSGEINFHFRRMQGEDNDISFYFTEHPAGVPFSVLSLPRNASSSPLCFHSLTQVEAVANRTGCPRMENMFDIIGSNGWSVVGGEKSAEFVVHNANVSIDGGGGEDTIKQHESFSDGSLIDLSSAQFENIENVVGAPGVPLIARCGCEAKLVTPQGGSQNAPDVIYVAGTNCSQRNIQVVAIGHSRVVIEDGVGSTEEDKINIFVAGVNKAPMKFQLDTMSTKVKMVMVAVVMAHKRFKLIESRRSDGFVHASIEGAMGEMLKLILKEDAASSGQYLEMPFIQLSLEDQNEAVGQLIVERERAATRVLFDLDGDNNTHVVGYQGIQNMFRFRAIKPRHITGGDASDIFSMAVEANSTFGISIDGGEGEDTLYVDGPATSSDSEAMTFVINLPKQEFGLSASSSKLLGKITNIENFIGRPSAPDIIHTDCNTQTVIGREGSGPGLGKDLIIIPDLKCNPNLAVAMGKFTNVRNQALKGNFVYNVHDIFTTSLELRVVKSNLHQLKFAFDAWKVIKGVAWDNKTESIGLKFGISQDEKIYEFAMTRNNDTSEEFNNPVFEFSPAGSQVSSDIRVRQSGVTMSTFVIRGDGENITGLPVDVNRFLINVTEHLPNSQWNIQGCSDPKRCSANQFWIFKLDSPLSLLDGGDCLDDYEADGSGCKNNLHLQDGFYPNSDVWVDLSPNIGSAISSNGSYVIKKLKNIHELHGSRGVSAYVTCKTAAVTNVDKVTIKGEACPLDLVIGLEEWTQVMFEEANIPNNMTLEERVELFADSTVHYRFTRPMSFDPEGSSYEMLTHSHNYYLSFTLLNDLESIDFDLEKDVFYYNIGGTTYHHTMITTAGYIEQFYAQPSMVTIDGFKLEVARDGSLYATLGETVDISPDQISKLQNTANRLKITMILQTSKDFFFIGYSGKASDDRTVLQNVASVRSHLCGGGGANAIYEILHLDNDVYIYSGLEEETFDEWAEQGNGTKQTIDLTDVVVPIRLQSGTKYIPKLETVENNLVISMKAYEKENPGKVAIVNGAYEWTARRLQLLLNNAIMDLQLVPSRIKRDASSELNDSGSEWIIKPRPVMIPDDITIYSISPEDLEDGHEIRLDSSDANSYDFGLNSTANEPQNFKVVRSGDDLYLTNVGDQEGVDDSKTKTIIISDYYGETEPISIPELQDISFPREINLVTVSLPGVSILLNESKVSTYELENSTGEPTPVPGKLADVVSLDSVLYEKEGSLLKDLPDIQRTFECDECTGRILFLIAGCAGVIFLVVLFCVLCAPCKMCLYGFVCCYSLCFAHKHKLTQTLHEQAHGSTNN